MMEEMSCENGEKLEEIMLPGFRFHPTDEELVGFYLKRKIQQRPLSIQVIKQLDIYKYDPWDLPKLATTGEKEWYFYCPRDRKYRNSARPNRVTGAGFWKATGTDRPIYSSEGSSKCIGLKKSLVFYKGRAAKGTKTDWMMHEFRLPSLSDHTVPSKRFIDNNIPANDSWAICRIFKKANSSSHRALSHSWVSPLILPETTSSDMLNPLVHCQSTTNNSISPIQYGFTSSTLQQHSSITTSFSSLDQIPPPYKPFNQTLPSINTPSQISISSNEDLPNISYAFLSPEKTDQQTNPTPDASWLLYNMSSTVFGDFEKSTAGSLDYGSLVQEQYINGFSVTLPLDNVQENVGHGAEEIGLIKEPNEPRFDDQWGSTTERSFLVSLPDSWKSSNFLSDSSSEISSAFSTNKCYT